MLTHPVEKLRRIWTPNREIEELTANLDPQTELDSIIRDLLHRTIQQYGPVTLTLEENGRQVMNEGTLRWEIVHHQPAEGIIGRREISVWVEGVE